MDIHLLSDTELNEAIAKARGYAWRQVLVRLDCEKTEWISGEGCVSDYPPDFTHDRGLAMELLEEMGATGDTIVMFREGNQWTFDSENDSAVGVGDTPQRAIAEAWLEWKGT